MAFAICDNGLMHAFRFLPQLLGLGAICALVLSGCAGSTPADVAEGVHSTQKAPVVFRSGIYRGTIGQQQVEMQLLLDPNSADSVHGWYAVAGDHKKAHVLLAGELEDEALSMEESINGVDVSGHFNAVITAQSFSGEWSDSNGENLQKIEFTRLAVLPPAT